jgi:adenylyltransferase and sulfurtransferase
VRYIGYRTAFGAGNAVEIVEGKAVAGLLGGVGEMVEGGYDVVLDCTDNPATRYLISDVCVVTGRVLVSAAAQRGEGQLMRLCYPPPRPSPSPADSNHDEGKKKARTGELAGDKGPCYRCVFPTPPPPETVQSCSEIGILGPVVGVMGTLMAMEVLKIVTAAAARKTGKEEGEQENSWRPTLLLYNALSPDPRATFRGVGLRKSARRDCLACGDEGVLSSRENGKEKEKKITRERIERGDVDYLAWCGSNRVVVEEEGDGGVLERKRRIGAGEFVERMRRGVVAGGGDGGGGDVRENLGSLVVDVREEVEYELGTKVKGSINIPISRILRHGQAGNHDDDDGAGAGAVGMELEQLLQESSPPAKKSDHDNTTTAIYFVCQRGNDSQVAARRFLDAESQLRSRFGGSSRGTRWIGDVVGGFEALQRYLYN